MRLKIIALFLLAVLMLSGCTGMQKGLVIGGLGGAAAGGAIGYFSQDEKTDDAVKGAAIGALTGAVAGAIIGYFMDE